jgi:hypothetical protein
MKRNDIFAVGTPAEKLKAGAGLLFIVAVIVALPVWNATHREAPEPDPYEVIEARLDFIDLDQPKDKIRMELDDIADEVHRLNPDNQPSDEEPPSPF